MNETILNLAFTGFFITGAIITVFFLACMIVDEERKGARK